MTLAAKLLAILRETMLFLIAILRALLFGWIVALVQVIRTICERCRLNRLLAQLPVRARRAATQPCVRISDPAYKRPDPMIYSQYYLMQQGLAVTWDNPDIEVQQGGMVVPSHQLQPDTVYDVVARIWNTSTEAPVVGLPVAFSYLSFGMGTQSHPVGLTHVNLGVKGGPGQPAFATVPWKTPATPGHYCLQVYFAWIDDLNPNNNLGQENTDVGLAASPAVFQFQLRNDTRQRQPYRFEADVYAIPPLNPCETAPPPKRRPPLREAPGTVEVVPPQHARANYPVPLGWALAFDPPAPFLDSGQEITVQLRITPPDSFHGSQIFNVHAFNRTGLAGGITVQVQRP